MNRENIIKILKKYNFDNEKYIVISGASMVIHGIKDKTSDIDIAVTKDYYEYLLNHYECIFEVINMFNHRIYIIDNIINCKTNVASRIHYSTLKNTKKNTQNLTIPLHVCKIYVKFKDENSRTSSSTAAAETDPIC